MEFALGQIGRGLAARRAGTPIGAKISITPVMTGLVPVSHVGPTPHVLEAKICCCSMWVAGTSPAMTVKYLILALMGGDVRPTSV
jgi:hypothetical protein